MTDKSACGRRGVWYRLSVNAVSHVLCEVGRTCMVCQLQLQVCDLHSVLYINKKIIEAYCKGPGCTVLILLVAKTEDIKMCS